MPSCHSPRTSGCRSRSSRPPARRTGDGPEQRRRPHGAAREIAAVEATPAHQPHVEGAGDAQVAGHRDVGVPQRADRLLDGRHEALRVRVDLVGEGRVLGAEGALANASTRTGGRCEEGACESVRRCSWFSCSRRVERRSRRTRVNPWCLMRDRPRIRGARLTPVSKRAQTREQMVDVMQARTEDPWQQTPGWTVVATRALTPGR